MFRYLAISTHTESLQLWDTEHYSPYQLFARSVGLDVWGRG